MASAPPVPPRKNSSQGLFHNIKQTIFSSKQTTVDEGFEEYKTIFETYASGLGRLSEQIRKLEENTAAWSSITAGVWDTTNTVFTGSQHNCTSLVDRSKNAHDNFSVKALPVGTQYQKSAADILNGVRRDCTEIQGRIEVRASKLKDYDYYQTKVAEMIKDKEDTLAKGKTFKNQEKLDRNLEKLSAAKQDYENYNTDLTDVLYKALVSRFDRLRPVIMALLAAERALARGSIDTLDAVGEGNIDALVDEGVASIASPQPITTEKAFTVPPTQGH